MLYRLYQSRKLSEQMILLLQTAQDIHVRLDKAIHGHVCLR